MTNSVIDDQFSFEDTFKESLELLDDHFDDDILNLLSDAPSSKPVPIETALNPLDTCENECSFQENTTSLKKSLEKEETYSEKFRDAMKSARRVSIPLHDEFLYPKLLPLNRSFPQDHKITVRDYMEIYGVEPIMRRGSKRLYPFLIALCLFMGVYYGSAVIAPLHKASLQGQDPSTSLLKINSGIHGGIHAGGPTAGPFLHRLSIGDTTFHKLVLWRRFFTAASPVTIFINETNSSKEETEEMIIVDKAEEKDIEGTTLLVSSIESPSREGAPADLDEDKKSDHSKTVTVDISSSSKHQNPSGEEHSNNPQSTGESKTHVPSQNGKIASGETTVKEASIIDISASNTDEMAHRVTPTTDETVQHQEQQSQADQQQNSTDPKSSTVSSKKTGLAAERQDVRAGPKNEEQSLGLEHVKILTQSEIQSTKDQGQNQEDNTGQISVILPNTKNEDNKTGKSDNLKTNSSSEPSLSQEEHPPTILTTQQGQTLDERATPEDVPNLKEEPHSQQKNLGAEAKKSQNEPKVEVATMKANSTVKQLEKAGENVAAPKERGNAPEQIRTEATPNAALPSERAQQPTQSQHIEGQYAQQLTSNIILPNGSEGEGDFDERK